MKKVDYQEVVNQIISRLSSKADIVLATTDGKAVSARSVYYIIDGLCIFFLTSKAYRKFKDIKKNPNVALCLENIQIEGIATSLGHPSEDKNKYILEKIESNSGMKQFLIYKNTICIKVDITSVEMWINSKRLFLDVLNQDAFVK